MSKKILLKAETHQGVFELPLTEKRALSFAKKLFENQKKELANWKDYTNLHSRRRRRYVDANYKYAEPVEPFLKVEFTEIVDEENNYSS